MVIKHENTLVNPYHSKQLQDSERVNFGQHKKSALMNTCSRTNLFLNLACWVLPILQCPCFLLLPLLLKVKGLMLLMILKGNTYRAYSRSLFSFFLPLYEFFFSWPQGITNACPKLESHYKVEISVFKRTH